MSFDFNPADEDPHGECRHEIERLRKLASEAIGGSVSDFDLLLSSERMARQEGTRAMEAVNKQIRIIQGVRKELIDLKRFAEAHHGDEKSHVWLHGLTVDVPHRIDLIIQLLS